MTVDRSTLVLGITGSFGSGCSTLAQALQELGYTRISLSSEIRTELTRRRKEQGGSETRKIGDNRKLLQNLGNELRAQFGLDYLAKKAFENANQLPSGSQKIVFDGIRNTKEVDYLRNTFSKFFLITVWCPQRIRWERVRNDYSGDWAAFEEDDKRDSDEQILHGQQVQLCVDSADIVIRNDENHTPNAAAVRFLRGKIEQFLNLITGDIVRPPHFDELAMAVAYTSSLRSQCLKRTVGAAITTPSGVLVSSGYNENPEPMLPCYRQYGYCYKDAKQREHIEIMIKKRPQCPECLQDLGSLQSLKENFKCGKCGYSLLRAYSPDRGMSRCTAVHAEMAAVLNASGRDLRDKVLYTTTFPCAQCARQIAYVGIRKVVYVEPYPDPDSESFLRDSCGISLQMFEGVKARAYDRVFNTVRLANEKKYSLPH